MNKTHIAQIDLALFWGREKKIATIHLVGQLSFADILLLTAECNTLLNKHHAYIRGKF